MWLIKVKIYASAGTALTILLFIWTFHRQLNIDLSILLRMHLKALRDIDFAIQFGHFWQLSFGDLVNWKVVIDSIVPLRLLLDLLNTLIFQILGMHPRLSLTLIPLHHVIPIFLRNLILLLLVDLGAAGRLGDVLLSHDWGLVVVCRGGGSGRWEFSWGGHLFLATLRGDPVLLGLLHEVGFCRLGQPAYIYLAFR